MGMLFSLDHACLQAGVVGGIVVKVPTYHQTNNQDVFLHARCLSVNASCLTCSSVRMAVAQHVFIRLMTHCM